MRAYCSNAPQSLASSIAVFLGCDMPCERLGQSLEQDGVVQNKILMPQTFKI